MGTPTLKLFTRGVFWNPVRHGIILSTNDELVLFIFSKYLLHDLLFLVLVLVVYKNDIKAKHPR